MLTIFMQLLLLSMVVTLLFIIYNLIKLKENNNIFIKLFNIYISECNDLTHIPDNIKVIEILKFNNKKISIKNILMKITMFLISILIFLFFLLIFITPSYDDIYNKNYKILSDNSFVLRGNNNNYDAKFRLGIDNYLNKKYNDAETIFNELLYNNNASCDIYFYSGINKMALYKFDEAILIFNNILLNSDEYNIETQWYIGLCYIKLGDKRKAISSMKKLLTTESIYKEKAEIIINEL